MRLKLVRERRDAGGGRRQDVLRLASDTGEVIEGVTYINMTVNSDGLPELDIRIVDILFDPVEELHQSPPVNIRGPFNVTYVEPGSREPDATEQERHLLAPNPAIHRAMYHGGELVATSREANGGFIVPNTVLRDAVVGATERAIQRVVEQTVDSLVGQPATVPQEDGTHATIIRRRRRKHG
jgi:hypothetical protein